MSEGLKSFVVAAVGDWNFQIFNEKSLGKNWAFVSTPKDLDKKLMKLKPCFIFFLHWRWIVPDPILEKYKCICFHMTDLPYGRGGSPLQNLILNGHKETKLSAIRMSSELDAGPVYLKKDLSLDGPAWKIYERASLLSWDIIKELITKDIRPKEQVGQATYFKRRRPCDSEIPQKITDTELYDFIRMLDVQGYPKAFLRHGNRLLEFDQASLESGELTARVRMVKDERN
jgi:methionyl-tRNA formyltransferase